MDKLIQADVFFFITGTVVIFIGIIVLIVSFYVIRILHSVRYIAKKIQSESDHVSEDIAELRGKIKEGGLKFSTIAKTLAAFFMGKAATRTRRKSETKDN